MPIRNGACRTRRFVLMSSLAVAAALVLAAATGVQPGRGAPAEALRVMTFNLWHGGDAGGQPIDQSVAVIRASGADIVGLQETAGHETDGVRPDRARQIAEALGWHYVDQGGRTGVISRFPIVAATPRKWGVVVEIAPQRRVYVFNAHLAAAPYQPYQLLQIPYHHAPFLTTEAELIEAARAARGPQVDRLVAELGVAVISGLPVIVTGDFNEPSHLDWTDAAVEKGVVPMAVEYPTSRRMTDLGLIDAYRAAHPDETSHPGWTWTPITREDDPADRHDRIDLVYAAGPLEVVGAQVVGERAERADIVVSPYPSDHRAVVAEFRLTPLPVGDR